jgi:hypothetical protein
MISDFLVMHPDGPFHKLDSDEYNQAITAHPSWILAQISSTFKAVLAEVSMLVENITLIVR